MSIKPWFRHLNKKVTEKPFAQMNYARPGFYNEPPPGSGQNVIGTESLYGQNFDIMDSDIPQMGDPDPDPDWRTPPTLLNQVMFDVRNPYIALNRPKTMKRGAYSEGYIEPPNIKVGPLNVNLKTLAPGRLSNRDSRVEAETLNSIYRGLGFPETATNRYNTYMEGIERMQAEYAANNPQYNESKGLQSYHFGYQDFPEEQTVQYDESGTDSMSDERWWDLEVPEGEKPPTAAGPVSKLPPAMPNLDLPEIDMPLPPDGGGGGDDNENLPPNNQGPFNKTLDQVNKTEGIGSDGRGVDDYYKFQQMLNTAALASNLMQPGIPPIYYKNVMAKMMRHDRTQAELAKTQAKEAQANQMYQARMYGGGQQSGRLAGQAAVTSGTQKALRDISGQDKQMELGIDQQNMQANMQAAQMNTENYNKNLMYNHQNAAEHARNLSAALSSNLQSIGKTAGEYAKFAYSKQLADRMEATNRQDVEAQNNISKLSLMKQMTEGIMSSSEYATAKNAAMKRYYKENMQSTLDSPDYKGKLTDSDVEWNNYRKYKREYDALANAQKPADLDNTKEITTEMQQQYDKALKVYEKAIAEKETMQEKMDLLDDYYNSLNESFVSKGYGDIFESTYIHSKGAKTMREINEAALSQL